MPKRDHLVAVELLLSVPMGAPVVTACGKVRPLGLPTGEPICHKCDRIVKAIGGDIVANPHSTERSQEDRREAAHALRDLGREMDTHPKDSGSPEPTSQSQSGIEDGAQDHQFGSEA